MCNLIVYQILSVGSKDELARPNCCLGSQFICVVGLGILPWVVLGLGTQLEALPPLPLCFLLFKSSLSLSLFPKLHPLPIPSFLLFIAFVNGVIIIIFFLSAKKGPMSMNLSGFLGTSGFRNGSHYSKCVWQRSFLRFYRALKWWCDRAIWSGMYIKPVNGFPSSMWAGRM